MHNYIHYLRNSSRSPVVFIDAFRKYDLCVGLVFCLCVSYAQHAMVHSFNIFQTLWPSCGCGLCHLVSRLCRVACALIHAHSKLCAAAIVAAVVALCGMFIQTRFHTERRPLSRRSSTHSLQSKATAAQTCRMLCAVVCDRNVRLDVLNGEAASASATAGMLHANTHKHDTSVCMRSIRSNATTK